MKKIFYTLTGLAGLFLIYRTVYYIWRISSGAQGNESPAQAVLYWLPAGVLLFFAFLIWFNRKRIREALRRRRDEWAQKKREQIERLRAEVKRQAALHGEEMGEDILLSAGASALTVMELYAAAQAAAEAAADAVEEVSEAAQELSDGALEAAGEALENTGEAGEVLEDVSEGGGGGTDALPYIALLLFGRRLYLNTRQLRSGRQTRREWQVNTIGDAVRIGAKTISAKAGAAAGGAAGTVVAPGIGTAVGAGVGALAGAAATGIFLRDMKSAVKWGHIMEAQEKIGMRFDLHAKSLLQNVTDELLRAPAVRAALSEQKRELAGYRRELDPYSLRRPTLDAVRTDEYCGMLLVMEERICRVEENLEKQIRSDCAELAKSAAAKEPQRKQIADMLAGELLIGNRALVSDWAGGEYVLMKEYDRQKTQAPNYPCRFPEGAQDMLRRVIGRAADPGDPVG